MKMRDLKDTINFMTSDDYKDRLIAEYWQLKIRYQKLQVAIARKKPTTRPRYKNSDRRAPGTVTCNGKVLKSVKTKSQRRRHRNRRTIITNSPRPKENRIC